MPSETQDGDEDERRGSADEADAGLAVRDAGVRYEPRSRRTRSQLVTGMHSVRHTIRDAVLIYDVVDEFVYLHMHLVKKR